MDLPWIGHVDGFGLLLVLAGAVVVALLALMAIITVLRYVVRLFSTFGRGLAQGWRSGKQTDEKPIQTKTH